MGVNKVIYGDTPIVDLTDSTVTPQNLLSGEVAYSASGNRVVGEVVTTTVVPNPTGTPTDELLAIQIGNDIYSLPEGESEHLLNDILTGPDATKATASSTSQDGAIWKAFDGVKTGTEQSCWIPEYGSTNCWICYHFATPKYITKCHVYFYENMSGTYTGAVKIQGSNDGETWTDISQSQALSMTRGVHDYEIESTDIVNGYSYVRMFSETALVVYGSASACTLELEIYGKDNASSGGGHTILNDNGIPLAQENNLQFKGTYSHDDSTNGKTIVEVTRSMTRADFDQLTPAEKKGVISIIDENGLPWKDITGVLPAGETEITLGDIAINSNSTFDIYTSPIEVSHDSAELIEGTETVLQPLITQESELLGTITVASTLSGYDGWKAFTSTSAWVGAGNIDQWFAYEFPTDVVVSKIQWNCDDGSRRGTATSIQYSSNGTTWNDCTLSKNERGDVEISSINSAKHWRLFFAAPFSSWTEPMINNLEFISTVNGVKITFPAQAENLNVKVRIS